MNFLEERIMRDGIVRPGNVLKVDSFLNHQMDTKLMEQIGIEFKRRFGHKPITKVLTIEASGIAVAIFVAHQLGVPMVFAKKSQSINIDGLCSRCVRVIVNSSSVDIRNLLIETTFREADLTYLF